jgi:FkbM family methyltransferase
MRRQLREFLSPAVLQSIICIPKAILKIRNWRLFLLNYVGLKDAGAFYLFRDGTRIRSAQGIDSVTIKVVYLDEHYGEIADHSVVIDIGANIGVFSVFAATRSNNCLIYAYEPAPKSYELLLENVRLNGLEEKVRVFPLGVAGARGRRRLVLGNGSPSHSLYSRDVRRGCWEIDCVTLRDVFDANRIQHCDILKIDAEGAEFEILYGTPIEYLRRIREIRMEYHHVGEPSYDLQSLLRFLAKHNFRPVKLTSDSMNSGNLWLKQIA